MQVAKFQKSMFYFTDHSLTGQSASFLYCWLTPHNRPELFSTNRSLTDALRLRKSDAATRRPRVGLSGQGVVRKMLAIFISPITL